MTQSQRVTNLVGSHKAHGIAHQFCGHLQRTGLRIDGSRLYDGPLVDECLHIMPPDDVGLQNLSCTRVNGRWSHGVALLRGSVCQHRVAQVVTVNIETVVWHQRTDGILETSLLEGTVPVSDAL